MRKAEKKEILDFVNNFYQAHEEIKKALIKRKILLAQNMLSECQEFAIQLGETIEKLEGEGHITVTYVEEYCEGLFHVFEEIEENNINVNKITKRITKLLVKIENSIKHEILARTEVVFFPYKVSMWDSLESVYLAAKEDPDCDVYCVPIPYYEVLPDHSLGQMHYEGNEYPEGIEVVDWRAYRFEDRRPDIIYIHNPYDDWNYVTSVHPRFYSENLKKYTDTLVYIPYYSTTGGMAEAQKLCPAYIYADYIITQAPGFRAYFDERIPDRKFLPFGSPKFDKIIKKCENPPTPTANWKAKMEGKKVYFYNTSINGMLAETKDFLKKMRYVFSCFEERNDACLLWRPHPLLESTFASMRPRYLQEYLFLKQEFLSRDFGIYDTTPDMEDSIALSDAYIGDAASSVVSLFGIVGKPIFILNNKLHSEPKEDSWRGEICVGFHYTEKDRFSIVQGNKLYISEPFAHDYKYLCDLSDYVHGGDYNVALGIGSKYYVCPQNAQNILVIDETGKKKIIELEQEDIKSENFFWSDQWGEYIILWPRKYPAIVGYKFTTGELKYIREDIGVFIKEENGTLRLGGGRGRYSEIYFSSPTDNQVYVLNIESGEHRVVEIPTKLKCGYRTVLLYKDYLWFLPYIGENMAIIQWNPDTNEVREYGQFPQGFRCVDTELGIEIMERPFYNGAFYKDYLYLTPDCANMYIKLNIVTGKMAKWEPPFEDGEGKEYFYTGSKSSFIWSLADEKGKILVFSYPRRKLYEINFETNGCIELDVHFDVEELKKHEPGFCRSSEWLRYCCYENSFNSIKNFLDGEVSGKQFDRRRQIEEYKEIASNNDGTCGIKIHEFISRLI